MHVLITKTRGRDWHLIAIATETGEIVDEDRDGAALNIRLWRAGCRLSFAMVQVRA